MIFTALTPDGKDQTGGACARFPHRQSPRLGNERVPFSFLVPNFCLGDAFEARDDFIQPIGATEVQFAHLWK